MNQNTRLTLTDNLMTATMKLVGSNPGTMTALINHSKLGIERKAMDLERQILEKERELDNLKSELEELKSVLN